jgi:hypothetical protein
VVTRSHYGRPKAYSISASLRSNPPIGRSSSLLPGVIGGVGRCFISRPIMIAQLADVAERRGWAWRCWLLAPLSLGGIMGISPMSPVVERYTSCLA